ncbi:uncharacterized protein [Typha latifolia]|uniref:uncharacterized protein n=1 Tax=Typha latifolia TaxID=4733 RepID=UPI003C30C722
MDITKPLVSTLSVTLLNREAKEISRLEFPAHIQPRLLELLKPKFLNLSGSTRLTEFASKRWESSPATCFRHYSPSPKRQIPRLTPLGDVNLSKALIEAGDGCTLPPYWKTQDLDTPSLVTMHDNLLLQKENYWHQRGRVKWLAYGDKNNKFFHSTVIARRRNHIDSLHLNNRDWTSILEIIRYAFLNHFKNTFTTNRPPSLFVHHVFERIQWPKIDVVLAEGLCGIPTDQEVEAILKGEYEACCLRRAVKPFLGTLISGAQNAFIQGRQIIDNQVLVQEVISYLEQSKGKVGSFMIKEDLSKAFDRIEWGFIYDALKVFGFPMDFIRLIRAFLSSASLAVEINGNANDYFTLTRGIRQGYSLSPYLFIIGSNVLSLLLEDELMNARIKGIKIARGASALSHLMFADDLLIFGKARMKEEAMIKDYIDIYCSWSGQAINLEKFAILFSFKIEADRRNQIMALLKFKNLDRKDKYLGNSMLLPRSKIEALSFVISIFKEKLDRWKAKFLSHAGRLPAPSTKRCIAEGASPSNHDKNKKLWNLVWRKIEVIPRVRAFQWRCLVGALPMLVALGRPNSAVDTNCPTCHHEA